MATIALDPTPFDRDDAVVVSSVFADDENADEVSRYQLDEIRRRIDEASRHTTTKEKS